MRKELGKIAAVRFGAGGYQDAMFGLTVTMSFNGGGTGCCDFKGQWAERSPSANYTEQEWREGFLDQMLAVKKIMDDAKVDEINKLVGTPIEAEFDGVMLKSWRVLTEVL
jgi:hypothetical protein